MRTVGFGMILLGRMRGLWLKIAALAGLGLGGLGATPPAPPAAPAPAVIILANASVPESVALARYYAERRGIPEEQIIALPMRTDENTLWADHIEQVHNPLLDRLAELGWIDAVVSDLRDPHGRRRAVVSGHRIRALVVMRGVPLRIHGDEERLGLEPVDRLPEPFRVNRGSVDGQLALLALPGAPTAGFVPNPLFRGEAQVRGRVPPDRVIPVTRLDGPSEAAVRRMIDGALEAERDGLLGRSYVDFAEFYPRGEAMLEGVAAALRGIGWPPQEHRPKPVMGVGDRCDAPAVYFGWYETHVSGPFTLPGFRFPPGAIAVHIHSYSAETVRDEARFWCGPLIARGAAVTVGNVFEPYLDMTHHLDVFFRVLADGGTVAEAGVAALPVLGWQAVVLGDPLYRPFRVPAAEAAERATRETVRYGQYAGVRLLEAAATPAEREAALAFAGRIQLRNPGVALALALAEAEDARGRRRAAISHLDVLLHLTTFPADEWAVVREAVRRLEDWGEGLSARRLRERLLAQPGLPEELATAWR